VVGGKMSNPIIRIEYSKLTDGNYFVIFEYKYQFDVGEYLTNKDWEIMSERKLNSLKKKYKKIRIEEEK
jgi:tRNA A22 N-methylase